MSDVKVKSRASTVQQIVTAKGISAWLVEDYAVPLIAVEFCVDGGAAQDKIGKAGSAGMLAGLLDEGAGQYDSEGFHEQLDNYAIEMSFGAGYDYFSGRMRVLTKHFAPAFDLLKLALNEATLAKEPLERVRSQMVAGIKRDAHDPHHLANEAWRELAYVDHAYSRASDGTLESVAKLKRADLEQLRRSCFARDSLHIAVVGAISASQLSTYLDAVFGAWPEKGARAAVKDAGLHSLGERKIIEVDVPQATIQFGMAGIGRKDPDHVPGFVANHILGGGVFSARLFREVREKRGLAYSVHTSLSTSKHSALFIGSTSTKNERAMESLSVIEDEIAKMAADGPTEEELVSAKKYLTGSYALRFDTSSKIASQLNNLQSEGFAPSYLDERNAMIDGVEMATAKTVAKRLFDGKKLLVTMAGKPEGV